jgi:hypothetical protein
MVSSRCQPLCCGEHTVAFVGSATAFGSSFRSRVAEVKRPSPSIRPQATAIATGQTIQFTAGLFNDTTGVTWSATAGTIEVNGLYTAPAAPQSMTVTVTATSKKDPTKSATAVNVVGPGLVSPTANGHSPRTAILGEKSSVFERRFTPPQELKWSNTSQNWQTLQTARDF